MPEPPTDLRDTASRVAAGSVLIDLRLLALSSQLYPVEVGEGIPYEVSLRFEQQIAPEMDDGVVIANYINEYAMTVQQLNTTVVELNCVYLARYQFAVKVTKDDEIEAFGRTTVALTLHPYVRELLHDTSGRFGIRPILLPVYHQPWVPYADEAAADGKPTQKAAKKPAKKAAKRTGTTRARR